MNVSLPEVSWSLLFSTENFRRFTSFTASVDTQTGYHDDELSSPPGYRDDTSTRRQGNVEGVPTHTGLTVATGNHDDVSTRRQGNIEGVPTHTGLTVATGNHDDASTQNPRRGGGHHGPYLWCS